MLPSITVKMSFEFTIGVPSTNTTTTPINPQDSFNSLKERVIAAITTIFSSAIRALEICHAESSPLLSKRHILTSSLTHTLAQIKSTKNGSELMRKLNTLLTTTLPRLSHALPKEPSFQPTQKVFLDAEQPLAPLLNEVKQLSSFQSSPPTSPNSPIEEDKTPPLSRKK